VWLTTKRSKTAIQVAIPIIGSHTACNYKQPVLDLLEPIVVSAKERVLEVFLVERNLLRIVGKQNVP